MKFKYNTEVSGNKLMRIEDMRMGIRYKVVPFDTYYPDPYVEGGLHKRIGIIVLDVGDDTGYSGRIYTPEGQHAWYIPDQLIEGIPEYFEVIE